jgi:hypothetical protein
MVMRSAVGRPTAVGFVVALILSASLVLGSGTVASARPPTPQQAIEALAPGQHVVLGNVVVARTVHGLVVDVLDQSPTTASFCGVALASAIFGIGAGILGVIAASTGSGTVMIAGYLLTGAQVGVLAGLSGSYAALLAWISRFIC